MGPVMALCADVVGFVECALAHSRFLVAVPWVLGVEKFVALLVFRLRRRGIRFALLVGAHVVGTSLSGEREWHRCLDLKSLGILLFDNGIDVRI